MLGLSWLGQQGGNTHTASADPAAVQHCTNKHRVGSGARDPLTVLRLEKGHFDFLVSGGTKGKQEAEPHVNKPSVSPVSSVANEIGKPLQETHFV